MGVIVAVACEPQRCSKYADKQGAIKVPTILWAVLRENSGDNILNYHYSLGKL